MGGRVKKASERSLPAPAEDREIRAALSAAMTKLHDAEDEIVRALGIS
jgi:hypothetical protein